MGYDIKFISDLHQFKDIVFPMLRGHAYSEICISGSWDKSLYEEILAQIISNNHVHSCKIIVPHMSNKGVSPRIIINKAAKLKGQVRINSKLNNNLLIIGENVCVASFSYRESKEWGMKAFFECCMLTNQIDAVDDVKNRFDSVWNSSLPIVSEVI